MNEKAIIFIILAVVAVTATIGLYYTESPNAGQATAWKLKSQDANQPKVTSQYTTTRTQYTPSTTIRTPSATITRYTPSTQYSSCGTCRKWAVCGARVDQLMVNGQPGQCIDADKAASQGIHYCGKTANGQSCDPHGANRAQCVCR